jgi:hypothetical protein
MTEQDKKVILQRLTQRVSTGLHFIESEYLDRHENPDVAYIRNIYILLSYYSELLLKAVFVAEGSFENISRLDAQLIKLGHDLEDIAVAIGDVSLAKYRIKKVVLDKHEYNVETELGDFRVNDFVDIRYDFLDGRVRTIWGDEHKKFVEQIDIMRSINKQLQEIAWATI